MTDKPLLVLQDHSGDPHHREMLMEWAEEMDQLGAEPWDRYNVVVTDGETEIAEVPELDALADAVADRVVDRLED